LTPKLYKAGEVCEAAGLQPYVLRSWEKEFPGIGVQRSPESPRLYRQSDVEQVLRIKQLVFGEGLTLAGARRRIEESSPERPDADDVEMAEVLETLGADARARIAIVRNGLRSILDVLSKMPGSTEWPDPLSERGSVPASSGRGSRSAANLRPAAASPKHPGSKVKTTAKGRTAPRGSGPVKAAGAKRKRAGA